MRSILPFLALFIITTAQAEKPAMITRTFKVPPDFLSCETPSNETPVSPADPFGSPPVTVPENQPPHRKTAREVLETVGIEFPKGAGAAFNPSTGLLTVTNTQSNLDVIGAYMKVLQEKVPVNVACTLTVIEGPGELIRQANAEASRTSNATTALTKLLEQAKKADSGVRIVGDAFLETKSGTRATTEASIEYAQVTGFGLDAKSRASVTHETRSLGLRFEFEPNVDADQGLIDLTLAVTLDANPPVQRQINAHDPLSGNTAEFPVIDIHGIQVTTAATMTAGTSKLLTVAKPVGALAEEADVLWAAFLTATMRRVETIPTTQPKAAAPPSLPKGMTFAALSAPEGLFDSVLIQYVIASNSNLPQRLTLREWLVKSGVPFPPGASVEHLDGMLRVIHTPDGIATIASIVDELLNKHSMTVAITAHTIEAPASLLRELQRQTLAAADDSSMLAALEAASGRGEARFINSSFFEDKSGNRTSHYAACEHRYIKGFGTDAQGHPDLSFETRNAGTTWEIEPTIRPDGRTVDVVLSHELHSAPPTTRRDHFRDPGSQKPFEAPVTDFHVLKTMTSISLDKGSTKLISLSRPIGRESIGTLWATFLKCDVVPQVSKARPWFPTNEAGEPILPDPKAWNIKIFKVPPDFLSIGGGDGNTPPADPFAAGSVSQAGDKPIARKTAKQILEAQGITFPDGATAVFNPSSSTLLVKNTNENLDLVEAYTEWHCRSRPRTVAFILHVLQGPGPLLRRLTAQAANKSNHRTELDELLAAAKAGTVRHLNTTRLETKAGTRATSEQMTEHIAITEVDVDDKGVPSFALEMRPVGLRLEAEPTVGPDGATVELSLASEFHTAPPFEHREHVIDTQGRRLEFPLTDYHVARVTTGIIILDGTASLLSLYKPVGTPEFEKEDVLQVIFITCDILSVGE
ncbi:MAG: hypothetical protein U1F71_02135 [Verrucomicrobiaceae bacterium]